MKRLSVLMLSLFVVGLFMTMSSCQKSTGPTNDMFSSTEFQLPVTDNTPSDIQDASETSEFMMLPPTGYSNEDCQFMGWNGSRDGRDGGRFGDMRNGRGQRLHLGMILRKLDLTQEQIDAVKLLLREHMDCVRTAMQRLRESERAILQSANQERRTIMQQAKEEGWTREQLKAALQELAQSTREELKNNPVRVEVCLAIKDCTKTLLDGIEALLLSTEQLEIWTSWRDSLPEIKCGNE
ncbi:MAG: hypothetical protein A2X61_02645 [Ignavibacteria bacterium GWB2_35_12]|nr:MAG: hypothetical protein A2X63_11305 [Ignavibacteria bacterium GWA2_35_8]OGU42476.1 MAG: hypothetical protein A2X61_02645 [Ignavibacteria bacterium GWB2_35_12]OGU89880.1 MAG: hypothetical protein A2220_05805 [Ignavibacteria bacterium RIFOXYA2_FULL_35_10]OGV24256.1 MAG: hypothetical protein A2475_08570 [Ignavibacteria bacterium RIFOXYC2_FULL_35_21]